VTTRHAELHPSPHATPPRLTWARLVRLEPRLARVLAAAKAIDPGDNPHYCANRSWYGYDDHAGGGLRGRVGQLVGWGRRGQPGVAPALTTSEAFDIAYQTVYDALPGCRGCWCL